MNLATRLLVALTSRIIWCILALYPATFRAHFATTIERDITRDLAAVEGSWAALRQAFRAVIDTARGIVPEFVKQRRHGRQAGSLSPGIAADLRMAVRHVASHRASSLVVVLTMALAIGASTAIFSVVDAVLLRPLPFPQDDQLVRLDEVTASRQSLGISLPVADLLASHSWSRSGGTNSAFASRWARRRRTCFVTSPAAERCSPGSA